MMKNNRGLTAMDLLVGVFLLGMMLVIVPQIFNMVNLQIGKNFVQSDLDRLKQNLVLAAKNVPKIKKRIHAILGDSEWDKLLNCFGEKGESQLKKLPGVECKTKFTKPWATLTEPTGEEIFNKSWTLSEECTGSQTCLFRSSAMFYIPCDETRCSAVHLIINFEPTSELINLVSAGSSSIKNLSKKEVTAWSKQFSIPAALFNADPSFDFEACQLGQSFMSSLDFEHRRVYCNRLYYDETVCNTSVRQLGAQQLSQFDQLACAAGNYDSGDRGAKGEFDQGINLDDYPNSSDVIHRTLNVSLFGNKEIKSIPDPKDPTKTIQVDINFYNADQGDKVFVTCPSVMGERVLEGQPTNGKWEVDYQFIRSQFEGVSLPAQWNCSIAVRNHLGQIKGDQTTTVLVIGSLAGGSFFGGGGLSQSGSSSGASGLPSYPNGSL